ncbi:uncharacterized protein [Rutidosis leptorrhynchoides]|uniref:uncharacterized protein n=1 Tax=Rutidosis leptorrhynchoides TaxID=125765 RepID=UPI003A990CF9
MRVKTIVREDLIRKRWEEYFASLFGRERPEQNGELHEVREYQNNYFCMRINQEEVRSALRKMGRNKAVGPDQIPIEAWRCLEGDGVRWLTNLFNTTFRSIKMPLEWRLSELWESVNETRLRRKTKVSENHFGFMPGSSSMEAIHIVISLIEKYRKKRTYTWRS